MINPKTNEKYSEGNWNTASTTKRANIEAVIIRCSNILLIIVIIKI